MLPLVSHGAYLFNICPFPDSPAYVQHLFPISTAVWLLFPVFWIVDSLTPPPPPQCRRGVSWGELFLAHVHSQMNTHTCTEFGANRSIRVVAFPDLNLWPPETPEMDPVVLRGELYLGEIFDKCANGCKVGWQIKSSNTYFSQRCFQLQVFASLKLQTDSKYLHASCVGVYWWTFLRTFGCVGGRERRAKERLAQKRVVLSLTIILYR